MLIKTKGKRIVVIALDGTPYSLIRRLTSEGILPNLSRIFKEGSLKPMLSTVPCVSSTAWASFLTGVSPGRHNIYGFTDRHRGTYEIFVPTSLDLTSRTLWEHLSELSKRVFSMNVPVTYPPRKINGVLISGFLCIQIARAAYPPHVSDQLKKMGYRIDIDIKRAKESTEFLLSDLDYVLDRKIEAMCAFWEKETWDFFMVHIMETDRLHHFLWEYWEGGDPVYAPAFIRFYRKIDAILGEFTRRLGDDTALMILSDHGFCSLKKEVAVNRILQERGWLALGGDSLDSIRPESRAYSLAPGRIYTNLKGREPKGSVHPQDYNVIKDRLKGELLALSDPDTGDPVIGRVVEKEEIYTRDDTGAYDRAPDMIALPNAGYDLKGDFNRDAPFQKDVFTGTHTYDDAFLYIRGKDIQGDRAIWIGDSFPTVLELMELPVAKWPCHPDDLDGSSVIVNSRP